MKAEADSGSSGTSRQDSVPLTPDTSSIEDAPPKNVETLSHSRSQTTSSESTAVDSRHLGETNSSSVKSSGSVKGKSKPPEISEASNHPESSGPSHLVGKIHNLVTTDLENIGDARNFLLLFLDVPLRIALSIVFLYEVLGWR